MTLNQNQKKLIQDLIRFDTTSSNSNLELIHYVADTLSGTGASITIDYNDNNTKANILATVGPKDGEGGIILSGHTDTVPVTGQDWNTDPYAVHEADGKLFARGSVDMKGFNALALSQFIETAKDRHKLTRPLSILLTYDEEVGCFGAQNFVNHHGDKLGRPDLILVGEPTELKPVIAHKGIHCFEVNITGNAAHSSNPNLGISAIKYGSRAITLLYDIAKEFEISGKRDTRFTPPYSTLNVGTINGGNAVNIIANHCRFIFETRPIPGDTRDNLLRRLSEFFEEAAFQKGKAFEYSIKEYVANAPYEGNENTEGTQFLLGLLEDKTPQAAAYMSEASTFQNAGFNTVICGPGSITQAHQPNEFIEINQLDLGAKLIQRVVQRCYQPV